MLIQIQTIVSSCLMTRAALSKHQYRLQTVWASNAPALLWPGIPYVGSTLLCMHGAPFATIFAPQSLRERKAIMSLLLTSCVICFVISLQAVEG